MTAKEIVDKLFEEEWEKYIKKISPFDTFDPVIISTVKEIAHSFCYFGATIAFNSAKKFLKELE